VQHSITEYSFGAGAAFILFGLYGLVCLIALLLKRGDMNED